MDFDPRDHDVRDREPDRQDSRDPRDAFMRELALARGEDREIVRNRDHEYRLRGSEARTLSTVGAFRVVPASKLRDHRTREHTRVAIVMHADSAHNCCRSPSSFTFGLWTRRSTGEQQNQFELLIRANARMMSGGRGSFARHR
jgi:hypothetical protein